MILKQLLSRCNFAMVAGTVLIISSAQPAAAVSYVGIDLDSAGFGDSQALGISGHEPVGVGFTDSGGSHYGGVARMLAVTSVRISSITNGERRHRQSRPIDWRVRSCDDGN
jgi:hypothetical protein